MGTGSEKLLNTRRSFDGSVIAPEGVGRNSGKPLHTKSTESKFAKAYWVQNLNIFT